MGHVVICNVYNDNNRGSAALNMVAIAAAQKAFPGDKVQLLPLDHDTAGDLDFDFRHTMQAFPEVAMLEPLIRRSAAGFAVGASFISEEVLRRQAPAATVDAVCTADLVLSRGGVVHHSLGADRFRSTASMMTRLMALRLASLHRVPFILFGAQIGPYTSRLSERVAQSVLNSAALLLPRDPVSLDAALTLFPHVQAEPIPDSVFGLAPRETTAYTRTRPARRGGRVVAVISAANRRGSTALMRDTEAALTAFSSRGTVTEVVVVPHVTGSLDSDIDASRTLSERLRSAFPDVCVELSEEDLSPAQLISLYATADLVVSSRLHAAILSVIAGTPAVSIRTGYSFKERAVLSELGLGELAPFGDEALSRLAVDISLNWKFWCKHVQSRAVAARERLEQIPGKIASSSAKN